MTSFSYVAGETLELDGRPLNDCVALQVTHEEGGMVIVELTLRLNPKHVRIEVPGSRALKVITTFPSLADLTDSQLRSLEVACRMRREGN